MPKGGPRPGSGRPKGSVNETLLKFQFRTYFTEQEIQKFIIDLKEAAKKDNQLKKFIAEQIFGKAPQRIEMSGKDGDPIIIKWQQ